MMRLIRAAAAAIGLSLLAVGMAAATDDYTLPFTNPDVVMSYGVDRDARACVQLDWTGQTWADCATHWGRSYDNHSGQDYLMPTGSTVVAARDGIVIDYVESNPSTPGPWGNFVLVEHADGVRTLYYHLSQNGALVARRQSVKAGQKIAISGCSGNCQGAHLHYEVLVNGRFTDPHADRRWTTWPARIPYLGAYVGENNPSTVVVQRGRTVTHWVDFRNDGGRPWRNDLGVGGLMLATWNPALHVSAFRAADWYSSTVPTKVDQLVVNPGGVGRFTFGIKGGPVAGDYVEAYNLLANTVSWFDWGRLSGFVVPIKVTNFAP
jgi:murein DD-endopeptidase MepM/ murein hydrolase activator NlpD